MPFTHLIDFFHFFDQLRRIFPLQNGRPYHLALFLVLFQLFFARLLAWKICDRIRICVSTTNLDQTYGPDQWGSCICHSLWCLSSGDPSWRCCRVGVARCIYLWESRGWCEFRSSSYRKTINPQRFYLRLRCEPVWDRMPSAPQPPTRSSFCIFCACAARLRVFIFVVFCQRRLS